MNRTIALGLGWIVAIGFIACSGEESSFVPNGGGASGAQGGGTTTTTGQGGGATTTSTTTTAVGGSGGGAGGEGGFGASNPCPEGTIVCDGTTMQVCDGEGGYSQETNCADNGQICVPGQGCRVCEPGTGSCANEVGTYCLDDGSGYGTEICDPLQGLTCVAATGRCSGACSPAAIGSSYVGCDFWPTVVGNNVWSIFDYAAVVANASNQTVDATVHRGATLVASVQIPPNELRTIYLPWVPELKGQDFDSWTSAVAMSQSVRVDDGAYHLRTNYPVTVYQFSALEYGSSGGPPGKDWSSCPGDTQYPYVGCYSYSNDASLLLPSNALTGNYRLTGVQGWVESGYGPVMGSYAAVTGLHDGTNVTINLSSTGQILAGGGLSAVGPNGSASFTLNAGDVVEVVGPAAADLSGSVVQADKPVQVIVGIPCINIPSGYGACDHVEETIYPTETLGQDYFVVRPNGTSGGAVQYGAKIYGTVDGTTLSYFPAAPGGAPATIGAGQVVDLGVVSADFRVTGSQPFAVSTFLLGTALVGGGDPAMSFATAAEQYRDEYIFLAPLDYDLNYVNIVAPTGATVTLDATTLGAGDFTAIGATGFGVSRQLLADTGSHHLTADQPVGISVYGYGSYTSYWYPGGSNLIMLR